MEFSNTTTKGGIIQHCETLLGMSDGDISGNAVLLKVFTRLTNNWYRRADSAIWQFSSSWGFDDSDHTDLPRATANLVDDQHDYEIPSSARVIREVWVKDSVGNWIKMKPVDEQNSTTPLGEKYDEKGMPSKFDMVGRSLFLYPAPKTSDVTITAGLKVLVDRDIDEFVSTDTTKGPGFDNHFHEMVPVGASLDYALGYLTGDTVKINALKERLMEVRNELQVFYRGRDEVLRAKINKRVNRGSFA